MQEENLRTTTVNKVRSKKQCQECNKFVTGSNFARHAVLHFKSTLKEKTKICPFCNKIITIQRFKEHLYGTAAWRGCSQKHNQIPFKASKNQCPKCNKFVSCSNFYR